MVEELGQDQGLVITQLHQEEERIVLVLAPIVKLVTHRIATQQVQVKILVLLLTPSYTILKVHTGNCQWTKWLDRDNPGGTGDWETVAIAKQWNLIPKTCNSVGLEARLRSTKIPAAQTGEVFRVNDNAKGFACVNADQPDRYCQDYEVRYCCESNAQPSCTWTKWLDRDNPGGTGDWETVAIAKQWNLIPKTCDSVGLEARLRSDKTPAAQTGEVFRVNDKAKGFACVNTDQPDRACQDYEVRYCCANGNISQG